MSDGTTNNISESLRFPRGVRFAVEWEIPKCTAEILKKIAGANVRTGFCSKATWEGGFSAYLEANVHAERVWDTVAVLVDALLPEIAAPIICWKDADPILGPYTNKADALAVFLPHIQSLQHDGFIEFGLIFQYKGRTEEVYVAGAKYLRIWTKCGEKAEAVLLTMGLPKVDSLEFIDEFPSVTERLAGEPTTDDVISAISESFKNLPIVAPPEAAGTICE